MSEEERCDECGCELNSTDFIYVWENRGEYWGAPCQEEICTGYKCNACGHFESY